MFESEELAEIYDEHEFGQTVGWGDNPAVLVIDLEKGLTDLDSSFPAPSLGPDNVDKVVENTGTLVDVAHDSDVPVFFLRVVYRQPDAADADLYLERHPVLSGLRPGTEAVQIDDRLEVREGDYVMEKRKPSAFHDTELLSMLTYMGVDTVVVTGCSTSGCVRATVVDACQHGFHVIVPKEAVGDRHEVPHRANLFDMDMKYADVEHLEDVLAHLESMSSTAVPRSEGD
jgi:nicotinamidase-related amidase